MPINTELKALYPRDWKAISHRIRFVRAGGKCERCGIPHNWYRSQDGSIIVADPDLILKLKYPVKFSRIILTTAHLDHDPTNNDERNLAALCQRCQLAYDLRHHLASRRRHLERVGGQGRLFERI